MTNVAKLPVSAVEDPLQRYRRLSREIALCLDTMDSDIEYVMIRPLSKADEIGHGFIAYGPFNEEGAPTC
nr:MAG TPA: hypothetical protein [Caudoviricetes sp.]